ncbi:MAG TPA: HlyD family secretion protein [Vicinamibacterales bacterium]|nr:HlyD family secretion protein [Vicinamibacterales bacterium]
MNTRIRIGIAVVVVAALAAGVWWWSSIGRESTDDAQVDAGVTPIASRVGGTVLRVMVADNQPVEAGTVLVEIDPRDYQVALEHARAELADAEASAAAARAGVPITSTTTTSNVATATGGVAQTASGVIEAEQAIEVAKAKLTTAQARQREAAANATKSVRDVERFKPLLAKDEIAQQQFDAAVAAAAAATAAADSAAAQVLEAELDIRVAQSRLVQAHARVQQASAELLTAQTAPDQVKVTKARAAAADAHVMQAQAVVKQAEINLEYATVKAPVKGTVSRKSVEIGQLIQQGQPLMTLIPLDRVWVTANFKETQVEHMRPGQPVTIKVDAYGGRKFAGKVESLAAATGARFSLLPPDNSTGNYVKVVQRVPVRIALNQGQDPEHLLRPGMSVVPTVDTR